MSNGRLYSTLGSYLVPNCFLGPLAAFKIVPLGKNQSTSLRKKFLYDSFLS
jgi:hypothetical protein